MGGSQGTWGNRLRENIQTPHRTIQLCRRFKPWTFMLWGNCANHDCGNTFDMHFSKKLESFWWYDGSLMEDYTTCFFFYSCFYKATIKTKTVLPVHMISTYQLHFTKCSSANHFNSVKVFRLHLQISNLANDFLIWCKSLLTGQRKWTCISVVNTKQLFKWTSSIYLSIHFLLLIQVMFQQFKLRCSDFPEDIYSHGFITHWFTW